MAYLRRLWAALFCWTLGHEHAAICVGCCEDAKWRVCACACVRVCACAHCVRRCEKYRLDIAHLDMPMMTYEWFKTKHGPHFPYPPEGKPLVFPGVQFAGKPCLIT